MTHGTIDTSTIGEKYVEYKAVDSWGQKYNYKKEKLLYIHTIIQNTTTFTLKNNQTGENNFIYKV